MSNTFKSILVIGILFCSGKTKAQDTCVTNVLLGISFPPVADAGQRTFTQAHLDSLGVTKIRISEDWSFREPIQGNFNWTPLDERINWAYSNNYEVLLTIQSNGPSWACSPIQNAQSCVYNDNSDFQIYMDSLLQRYSGKIAKIQFGNEWQSDFWYAGNAGDFVAANNILFNSVQVNSPSTKVVLGGFTTISLRFLAGCNGAVSSFYDDDGNYYDVAYLSANCPTSAIQDVVNRIDSVLQFAEYDILDLHFYDDVEQWDEYYYNFSDTITKPIIVSEFGGPNMNYETHSEAYQSNRLYQYIKKLDSLEIQEAYYFKLVEGTANPAHANSGLIADTTFIKKSAYCLFQSFIECQTAVCEFGGTNTVWFYPNPAQEILIVEFEQQQIAMDQVQIYNSVGVLVLTQNIEKTTTEISVSQLSSGVYFIRLKNYPKQTQKIIKL